MGSKSHGRGIQGSRQEIVRQVQLDTERLVTDFSFATGVKWPHRRAAVVLPNLLRMSLPVPFSADDEIAFDELACLIATRFPAADWLAATADDGRCFVFFSQGPDQRDSEFVVMLQQTKDGGWEALYGLGDDDAMLASSEVSAGDAAVEAGIELLRQWLPEARVEHAPAVMPRLSRLAGRVHVQSGASGRGPESMARARPVLLPASGDGNMLLASYRAVRMKNAHHQVENLAVHLAAMRRSYAALEAARTVIRRVEESARFAGLRLG